MHVAFHPRISTRTVATLAGFGISAGGAPSPDNSASALLYIPYIYYMGMGPDLASDPELSKGTVGGEGVGIGVVTLLIHR